jgi:hypothetical protein
VFLAAAAIMAVAFTLAWRLRDIPLRETSAVAAATRPQPRTVEVQ